MCSTIESETDTARYPLNQKTGIITLSTEHDIIHHINRIITDASNILIVVSNPIDPDCIGTGLSLKWYLEEKQKTVEIIRYFDIPHEMSFFPEMATVKHADTFPDLKKFQAVILVDGCDWTQFFGDHWQKILTEINISRIINLDHHIPGDIQQTIPDSCLIKKTSCTAQLLYDYLIKPAQMQLIPKVANYLYLALLYDSGNFKYEIYPGQYLFAEKLIRAGADHARAMDINYDKKDIDFMVWAVAHTEYFPDLKTSLLTLSKEHVQTLTQKLGANWSDFDKFYKENFERQIHGYDYGIILIDNLDNTVRLGWRTRNYGKTVSIKETANRCGFFTGGHRNAGGGHFNGTIETAKKNLLNGIRSEIKQPTGYDIS